MILLPDRTLRDRLSIAVTLGVLAIALGSSLLSAWLGAQRIQDTLVSQGHQIAQSLATQSGLALLLEAPENAVEALQATLELPNIEQVELRLADGRSLWAATRTERTPAAADPPKVIEQIVAGQTFLEAENDHAWRFVAPVVRKGNDSPFQLMPAEAQVLGYVRVIRSKETLHRLRTEVFLTNLSMFVAFGILLSLLARHLATHLTQPLRNLSGFMMRAENGEHGVRAAASGTVDVDDMAKAFNRMMDVLEDREAQLEQLLQRQRQLMGHLESVREEKAREIAREIHDTVGGNLTMLKLGLASLQEDVPQEGDVAERLRRLLEICNSSIQLARNITASLRPTMLDKLGLNEAIRWYAGDWSRTTHIACHLNLDAQLPPLDMEAAVALFRIVQESLTNVARHARAGRVVIAACREGNKVCITIKDDGIGFVVDLPRGDHFGLLGMHERIEYVGGHLHVDSQPGSGTRVVACAPCHSVFLRRKDDPHPADRGSRGRT